MSSKLMPRDCGAHAQPIVYRTLDDSTAIPPLALAQCGQELVPAQEESNRLQARIQQLEQALTTQVAAARQAALREGEASGRLQAENAARPVMDRLGKSLHDLLEIKPRLRKEMEEDAVQLSLAIAKRVLRRELNVDPSALHGLVKVAFDRMGRNEVSRVLVHPEHVAAVREALALLTTRQIEIVADGSREKGTLIFETNRGALDASVDSQLREIEFGLADRLKWR